MMMMMMLTSHLYLQELLEPPLRFGTYIVKSCKQSNESAVKVLVLTLEWHPVP
jgi:hypothetical protein